MTHAKATATPGLRVGSFCSGICAPEVAWAPLGWQPQWFSEIDPFACAVEAHHFPGVPNLGDMTAIDHEKIKALGPIDVCVAGTPCQGFSVAGLRGGMDDARSQLAYRFLEHVERIAPGWVVWENVPGVLSSWSDAATSAPAEESRAAIKDARRAARESGFHDLAAALDAGEFEEAEQTNDFDQFASSLRQRGYFGAWGVLDAQYFNVAQRRERVFVVASPRDWRRGAAVLFDRECLSGNLAPSREAGARIAASITRGADSSGAGGYAGRRREDDFNIVNALRARQAGADDNDAQGCRLIPLQVPEVCPAIKSRDYKGPSSDGDGDGAILVPMGAHSLRADGFDASEDGTGRGTPIVPVAFNWQSGGDCRLNPSDDLANGLQRDQTQAVGVPVAIQEDNQNGVCVRDTVGSLRADAPGHQPCGSLVAYQCHGSNIGEMGTVRAGNGGLTGGVPFVAQPIPIDMRQASRGATMTNNRADDARSGGAPGTGIGEAGDPAPSISQSHPPAIAYGIHADALDRSGEGAAGNAAERAGLGISENVSPCINAKRPNAVAYTLHGADKTVSTATETDLAGSIRTKPPGSIENSSTTVVSQPIAFQERGRDGGPNVETQADLAYSLTAPNGGGRRQEMNVATPMAVRRLLPVECEKLQGFPRDWTAIPYRGKVAAAGPRYRALGNSMAVPVLRWIGERIEKVRAAHPLPTPTEATP